LRYFGIKDLSELPKEEDFGETVMSGYPELPMVKTEEIAKADEPPQDKTPESDAESEQPEF
jgi:hypothetical protein